MSDITHTVSEVLNDELTSRPFDLTRDERASTIVALRMLSKDFQSLRDKEGTAPSVRKHADFFIEQARSVIEKLGFPGV